MRMVERFVATFAYVISFFSFSSIDDYGNRQQTPLFDVPTDVQQYQPGTGPIFKPPTGRLDPKLPGADLQCDYRSMGPEWVSCSTPENRGCWLRNTKTKEEFNIDTDYESEMPKGIDRYYELTATDGWIFADGLNFTDAKFFWDPSDPESLRSKYPGPWIQACWGDRVHVNVYNDLKFNGTSVHWHGIRQLNTTHFDGVPGVTQCPIAPKDNFTYTWQARQYGSSWYHSHYSVQYADGAAGPLTIHGPTSSNWTEPKFPILMTDWGHNSAFEAIWGDLKYPSILLNGVGNVTRYNNGVNATSAGVSNVPSPYSITFSSPQPKEPPKRYLLRLINVSFESIFVFAIDNHLLEVISTDFVSIRPYLTKNVTIGIGQRYNVVISAKPIPDESGLGAQAKSFWIRTRRARCFRFPPPQSLGYEKAGVVYYDGSTAVPTTSPWFVNETICADEPYSNLHPVVEWNVTKPSNTDLITKYGDNFTVQFGPNKPFYYPLAKASMGGDKFNPLYIDYGNPIFLNLQYGGDWPPRWVVYRDPHVPDSKWAYLIIKSSGGTGAHPIHLHGHDFAILQQIDNAVFPAGLNLTTVNPPRRDVVLLPASGYVVIAFRLDNPGPWIMHCHIALHASFGLAAQIMESQDIAGSQLWPPGDHAIIQAQRTCNRWNEWWGNCSNWWYNATGGQKPGAWCDVGAEAFAPDSGI